MGVRLALRQMATNLLHATDGRDVLVNSPDGWEVEQPWLWWAGPGGGTLGPFGNPIPGASQWGAATSIPAVARATSLIVDTLAALPWQVYRDEVDRQVTPDWIADPQALRLDGRVVGGTVDDARLSRVDFWAQWILSALWYGDGFCYVPMRGADGAPRPPLWILNPFDVEIREDGSYWVAGERLGGSEVIHLRQPPVVEGRGTGVLARFSGEFAAALAQRDYTAGAFTAGVPAGYLKTSSPHITQDQADALKARWLSQHAGRRSIAVLNATTEFHPLTWSPVDLAATEFAGITLGQIALMFGVPAYLLGAPTDSNTYANVENRMLELYQLALLPWIGRIEAVLDAQLPRGTEIKVRIAGLLRADFKTQAESFKILSEIGVLTTNEIRRLLDRPPLPEEEAVV